jgi:hypothetical protein
MVNTDGDDDNNDDAAAADEHDDDCHEEVRANKFDLTLVQVAEIVSHERSTS